MPGSTAVPKMYANALIPVKAYDWINGLSKTAPVADRNDLNLVYGRTMYMNAAGAMVRGLAQNVAPIFSYRATKDGDVTGYEGEGQDEVISGIVGLSGYELQTTEFMTGSYVPNAMLTAVDTGGAAADFGKLKVGVLGTSTIIGMVSMPTLQKNIDNIDVLQFWTVMFPVYS